jgi:beta-glucanase (GH16 family)
VVKRSRGLRLLCGAILCSLAAVSCSGSGGGSGDGGGSAATPAGPWKLVWSDDFSGSALDPANWSVLNHSTYGDTNGEVACLTNRPANVQVSAGDLQITAQREAAPLPCGHNDTRFPQGRDYSSGMVLTRGLQSWTYGRFEIRAKLPTTPGRSLGLWPALWLRPVDGGVGEIDLMEAIGTDASTPADNVQQTLWYDYSGTHPKITKAARLPSGATDTGFHVYGLDWEPGSLVWTIDGHETMRADASWVKQAFSRPFYLRMNLAVGGSWPGDPTPATVLPSSLDIDYVHVYQHG